MNVKYLLINNKYFIIYSKIISVSRSGVSGLYANFIILEMILNDVD